MSGCLQVMQAVLRARERTDPAGWKQAQQRIQEAKLQRQRLQRETEDLEAALDRSYREDRLHPEGVGTACSASLKKSVGHRRQPGIANKHTAPRRCTAPSRSCPFWQDRRHLCD